MPVSIENFLKSIFDFMLEMTKIQTPDIGRFIVEGLLNGITANHPRLTRAINKVTGGVLDKFKEGLKEHSPSKATEEDGINLNKGLVNGIDGSERLVSDKISEFGRNILGKFKNALVFWQIEALLKHYDCDLDTPIKEIPEEAIDEIFSGSERELAVPATALHGDSDMHVYFGETDRRRLCGSLIA